MSWPWTTPEERVACERAASSLVDDDARDRVVKALARQHEPDDNARPSPPWSSWSLRLASRFGVREPERLAISITLLLEPERRDTIGLGLAIAGLDELGLARRDVGGVLLEASLLVPPTPWLAHDQRHESDCTPSKLARLFGLCALAAGRDPLAWIRFAAATTELLAMLQGLLDLVDDTERMGGAPPRIAALLRACRDEPSALDLLLDGCAGGHDDLDRWMALRRAATDPTVLRQLDVRRELLVAGARSALPGSGAEPGEAFLAALLDGFSQLGGPLWLRGVMARATQPSASASPSASVSAAVDYLEQTRPWASAWDVHRFHPMGASGLLVGRWFVEGMILLALAELGRGDRSAEIAALFEQVPEGEARYFPDWSGLPPDCDSLGLLLQLSTWLPTSQRGRLDGWIAVCEASLRSDQGVPTWFVNGPSGRMTSSPGPFLGDECTATVLAFLLGALRCDGERFASLFLPNLRLVVERGCEAGSLHYTREFTTHLLLRLIHDLRSHPSPSFAALCEALGLESLAAERCAALCSSQRLDGGWGSPQTTALALEGLIHWRPKSPAIARAVTYLVHTQGPDGAWEAEPLYITPGKFGKMVPFSAKPLTTALCMRALHLATVEIPNLHSK